MRKTRKKQRGGKRGLLIVLEGIDGSGKSTQAKLLVRRLAARGIRTILFREPTRGKWGRLIREKARRAGSLTPEEELDFFVKDRRENVERNLEPALIAGKTVVLDRYYFSTVAYQGAKGIDPGRIRRMNERFAIRPDLVFIVDIEAGRGLARIGGRGRRDELFEREDYLARVREIFRGFRGRKFVHIDGNKEIRDISDEILGRVLKLRGVRSCGPCVIASEAKQSHAHDTRLLRRKAPRNDRTGKAPRNDRTGKAPRNDRKTMT